MKNIITKATATIDVPASKVWEALTTPELVKQYFFGTDVVTDWKTGSLITFKGTWQGKPYEDKGIILHNEPNKLFQFTSWSPLSGTEDKPENYIPVSYELYEENSATTLTITQENIATEEARITSEENWLTVINNLKYLLEVGTAIPTA